MKKFLKNLKSGMMFSGLLSLCAGLLFVIKPQILTGAISFVLGGGLCLFGIFAIVSVFAKPSGLFSVGRMVPGIISLAVGLVFMLKPETFLGLVWVMIGIAVLIDAVYKLQYAFELKAGEISKWWINLLFALITLVFGVILILDPVGAGETMTRLAGTLLLINGIFDLATVGVMSAFADKMHRMTTVFITDAEEKEEPTEEKSLSSLEKEEESEK